MALRKITGNCKQVNGGNSRCTTVAEWNSCKIDVCGDPGLSLLPGLDCGGYLQSVHNVCTVRAQVGGQIHPAACNIQSPTPPPGGKFEYRLQFSHSGYGQIQAVSRRLVLLPSNASLSLYPLRQVEFKRLLE